MSASLRQREVAAAVLRGDGTKVEAAQAAWIGLSTLKRWLKDDPSFRALIASSPDIRLGPPPRLAAERGVPESQRDVRSRMWVAAEGEVLGSYIPPAAFGAGIQFTGPDLRGKNVTLGHLRKICLLSL